MSRNDQVTRQWLLLQRLERPQGTTLHELAASLPEDYACHPRTVRRDLHALEVRFPLLTERVGGQTRWQLMDGYHRTPPLAFSPTELMALVFSRDLDSAARGDLYQDLARLRLQQGGGAAPRRGSVRAGGGYAGARGLDFALREWRARAAACGGAGEGRGRGTKNCRAGATPDVTLRC